MEHDVAEPTAQKQEHESVVNARQRLALQRETVGPRHPDYATGLNQLALLLIMHGDPDSAEPLLREALDIRKETLGEYHPDYATSLSSLAGLLWARGDLDGAEPLLRKALDIRWVVLGANHPKSIVSLNSLEQLLQAKRDWPGAEKTFRAAPGEPAAAPPPPPETPAASAHDQALAEVSNRISPQLDESAEAAASPSRADESVESETHGLRVEPEPTHRDQWSSDTGSAREGASQATPGEEPAVGGEAPAAEAPVWGRTEERQPVSLAQLPEGELAEPLAQRFQWLAGQFADLAERLSAEADTLRSARTLPTEQTFEPIPWLHQQFNELVDAVREAAQTLSVANAEERPLESLEEVATLLTEVAEAEAAHGKASDIRDQALGVLDQVLSLSHKSQPQFAPLEECQARARELRQAIAERSPRDMPSAAQELIAGDHPFAHLLALIEAPSSLSDEAWAHARDVVEHEFGKTLAVAVARERLARRA